MSDRIAFASFRRAGGVSPLVRRVESRESRVESKTRGLTPPARRRPGFTLVEAVLSMGLLGAVLGVIVPLARGASNQWRRAEARRVAVLEASNALERMTADPASAPAAGETRAVPLPDDRPASWRDPSLTVAAVAVAGDVPGRRLDATLGWTDADGRPASVRLSSFLFGEGRP